LIFKFPLNYVNFSISVHIRVIVVTPDLKPYSGTANVTISDPSGNVIKQHKNMPIESGICGKGDSLKLTLTTEPPLGNWKIAVSVDEEEAFEEFAVDKYVLPTFEVEVKPPSFATVNGDITVFVTAKYTYGKSVEGNVTIKAHYPWPYYAAGEALEVQKMTTLDHSGEAVFRFANEELRQGRLINEFGYNQIKFTAVVTEKLTGQMRNGSAIVTVHKHPVKLVITRGADHFKPGLNYTFMIAAKAQDDQPIPPDATRKVYLNADFVIRSNQSVVNESDTETHIIGGPPYIPKREKYSRMLELDSNGTKVMNIETPSGALSLRIEVRYGSEDSSVYAYDYIDSLRSPSNNFAQLIPKQDRIQLGKMLSFDVRTSSPVQEFVALVISKGAIVHMSKIAMDDLRGTLQFEATAKMAPKSRVLIYGVLPDSKEIIVDALDLKVDGAYTNNIRLRINPSRVEPNTNVTFSVNAPARSFVGLLVVDQSALLLKSANDINAGVVSKHIF
ncbi:alpha-2-macroglobulin family protein, partial [Trichuris suis]